MKKSPRAKRARIICRVNNEELHLVLKKAHAYTGGNVSELLRVAVLAFTGSTQPARRKV